MRISLARTRWISARAGFGVLVIAVFVFTSVACSSEFEPGEQVSFDTVDADPDWSPDGRRIAFTSSRGGGGIYLIRPDGGGLRRLWRGEASDVDWSPDGRSLVFVGKDGLYLLNVRNGNTRRILRGKEFEFAYPAWSPDGGRVAFAREEQEFSSGIYIVHLDGRGLKRLLLRHRGSVGVARPGSPAALSEMEPAWSPDGRRIAFQAGDGYVVSASVESGRRRVIAEDGAYEPAWSPDGKLIAYQCQGEVWVANADGSGDERRLAPDGGDPSWAPDSRRLVFEHYLYGGTGYFSSPQSLSLVDLAGERERLTFGPEIPKR